MALRESTSSRIRCKNSRERRSWSRSAVRTGSSPARSASWFCLACDAATKPRTYQAPSAESRGFLLGGGPAAQAARGQEGVEDQLGRAGQRAQVAQRGRQQGGRLGPAESHQGGQVAVPDLPG